MNKFVIVQYSQDTLPCVVCRITHTAGRDTEDNAVCASCSNKQYLKDYRRVGFTEFESIVERYTYIWLVVDKTVYGKGFVRLTDVNATALFRGQEGVKIMVDEFDSDNLYIHGIAKI